MKTFALVSACAAAVVIAATPALARPDENNPNWPCVQRKVMDLSVSQLWDGPTIENAKEWFRDKPVADLVEKLASRRFPLDDAKKALKAFADAQPEAERDRKLVLVFAGLFNTVNTQRRAVIGGIEKYQKAQFDRSATLETDGKKIAELEKLAATDEKAATELTDTRQRYDWESRIFQERQANIPVACEVPQLIEERLFELVKGIRSLMKA